MAVRVSPDHRSEPPTVSAPAFIGRDRERAAVARALASSRALVLVEGEAGIGKSRLVREVRATGPVVRRVRLMATCPPYRSSPSLGPVVDALRRARPSVAGLRLSALGGVLRPLFPEWAADLPPAPDPVTDATAARHRLFRALVELLGVLDVGLLVVDDAHWADDATLELLLFLTSGQHDVDLGLVVTYRPEEVASGSLLRRLASRPPAGGRLVRVTLGGLDVAGTASVVSSMLDGQPVSEAFARFLHEGTGGVPLAVEESVRLMVDRADLVRQNGEWMRRELGELHVPPTVRDSVLERLDRLGPAAARAVRAAAVLVEAEGASVVS